ncbi:MAG TPA: Gfo/Idh/MocA family oxidoreductase [Micromonosporaceae bacterium]|nr:Gfo/Idh/MocA family oxidoreductase [Micromonosporaceae bacterium]
MTVPTVAVIGATGHGRWHLRQVDDLARRGRARLAAVCDIQPIGSTEDGPIPDGTPFFTDYRAMLAQVRPDVVVIVTPPQTHLAMATDALRSGADLLLEKPPTPTLAEHRQLAATLAETGRVCQVGFQALASPAIAALFAAVRGGDLGEIVGVSAVGAWMRSDAYYQRAAWAGRRYLGGHPTGDGALANPFAHAVMNCIAVVAAAGGDPTAATVAAELYRCRSIEVEDTACIRVTPRSGPPMVIAVTLCADEEINGDIIVQGTLGRAVLAYRDETLQLPADPQPRLLPGTVGPLENLLDHRDDPTVPLYAPLAATEPFTALLDVLRGLPDPVVVPTAYRTDHHDMLTRRIAIEGVNAAVRAAGERLLLFSELGVEWAAAPHRVGGSGSAVAAGHVEERREGLG